MISTGTLSVGCCHVRMMTVNNNQLNWLIKGRLKGVKVRAAPIFELYTMCRHPTLNHIDKAITPVSPWCPIAFFAVKSWWRRSTPFRRHQHDQFDSLPSGNHLYFTLICRFYICDSVRWESEWLQSIRFLCPSQRIPQCQAQNPRLEGWKVLWHERRFPTLFQSRVSTNIPLHYSHFGRLFKLCLVGQSWNIWHSDGGQHNRHVRSPTIGPRWMIAVWIPAAGYFYLFRCGHWERREMTWTSPELSR